METDLRAILERFGIMAAPTNIDLYRRSFVHRSYCKRKNETLASGNAARPVGCMPLQDESNERLEFLGDSVLGLVVASYLFERYPDQNEGFMTQLRTKLVNGTRLAELASAVGLYKWVIISRQIEESGGRNNAKVLEDCFEAFVGAVFLDLGFDAAATWLVGVLESQINFADLVCMTHSHKDMLVKHFQHAFNVIPKFVDVPGSAECTVCVHDPTGTVIAVASGPNRRVAENEAARMALSKVRRPQPPGPPESSRRSAR